MVSGDLCRFGLALPSLLLLAYKASWAHQLKLSRDTTKILRAGFDFRKFMVLIRKDRILNSSSNPCINRPNKYLEIIFRREAEHFTRENRFEVKHSLPKKRPESEVEFHC